MQYTIKSLDLGGILDESIKLMKNNFKKLFIISCCLVVPLTLGFNLFVFAVTPAVPPNATQEELKAMATGLIVRGAILLVAAFVFMFLYLVFALPLTNAASMHSIAAEYLSAPESVGDSFKAAFKRLGDILLTSFLAGIFVLLGTCACIIPGIYLGLRYFFAIYVVVLEGKSGMAALNRSGELMTGNFLNAFVLGLVVGAATSFMTAATAVIPVDFVKIVLQSFIGALATSISIAVGVVFYFSTRCKLENFDLTVLASAVSAEPPAQDAAASPN